MPFEWSKTRNEAAELIAERNLTFTQIAERLDVDRGTLWNWRQAPEFAARVEEIVEEHRAETRRIGIADKERRLSALNDRWTRLRRVIEERADAPEMRLAPGGSTGLLARTERQLGSGDSARFVDEYAVDTGLLKELREIEKQAAIELGQWDEKAPPQGMSVVVRYEDSGPAPAPSGPEAGD